MDTEFPRRHAQGKRPLQLAAVQARVVGTTGREGIRRSGNGAYRIATSLPRCLLLGRQTMLDHKAGVVEPTRLPRRRHVIGPAKFRTLFYRTQCMGRDVREQIDPGWRTDLVLDDPQFFPLKGLTKDGIRKVISA